jgi:hypothetical protein
VEEAAEGPGVRERTEEASEGEQEPLLLGEIEERLVGVARRCGEYDRGLRGQLRTVHELTVREQSSLSRFLRQVESAVYDEDDCDWALEQLRRGAPLIAQTRDALHAPDAPGTAAARARAILSRSEFRATPEADEVAKEPKEEKVPEETWWDRFWRQLADWLKGWLESDRKEKRARSDLALGSGAGGGLAGVMIVVVTAAVVGLLAWLALRATGRGNPTGEVQEISRAPEAAHAPDPLNALSRPPETWAALADELAARGEYRAAVRSLYLALLSRLHRDGTIDYDPTLSNWDYFRQFKGSRQALDAFRELTYRFDFTYYGNLGVSAEGYAVFRQLSRPFLLAAPVDREAASA